MPNRRTYTDDQLTAAVASAKSWSDVMEGIGKGRRQNRRNVRLRAQRIGLDTGHLDGIALHERPVLPLRPHPFQGRPHSSRGRAGLATASCWFLARGYNVSIPVEPAPYDLVVESDEGLKRVQVKTTNSVRAGRHEIRLTRSLYDPTATPNGHGRYRRVRYTAGEVDMFFVVTSNQQCYLIPIEYVDGLSAITVDEKYAAFLVE